MMNYRQPHTHATCGFCMRPKIIRSKPHETKSGQPICDNVHAIEYRAALVLIEAHYNAWPATVVEDAPAKQE